MARPLTREQSLQNRTFLNALRRTGNVRLAACEAGIKYGTIQHRRKGHPGFAQRWDAALAFAQAHINGKGRAPPKAKRGSAAPLRTAGGEMVICRRNDGKLQMRRAQPNKLTRQCEQAFLAALSATANVTLSAAAAGASPRAFYRRKQQCPAFARELRLALAQGYQALEMALLAAGVAGSHEHGDWRNNDPPPIPPMSVNQALQLMHLHRKAALMLDEPDYLKRRRGESRAVHLERLAAMAEERDRRAREAFEVAEAERRARGERTPFKDAEERLFGLPDLAQVTGWSRADPAKQPHDPDTALFGGWRIEDMEREMERRKWDLPS